MLIKGSSRTKKVICSVASAVSLCSLCIRSMLAGGAHGRC